MSGSSGTAGSAAKDRLSVVEDDITMLSVDAIVNAANEALAPGGGVCGAIHRAAGSGLAVECARVGGCPTGEARLTGGHKLPASYVIHAVGPVWHGGASGEDGLLAGCYRASLELAREKGLGSVAFPAISTGIFGFPADRAAAIAVRETLGFLEENATPAQVFFVCFDIATAAHYRALLKEK